MSMCGYCGGWDCEFCAPWVLVEGAKQARKYGREAAFVAYILERDRVYLEQRRLEDDMKERT